MSINKANQHCGWDSLIICDAQNSLGVHRLLMAGSQVPGLRSSELLWKDEGLTEG